MCARRACFEVIGLALALGSLGGCVADEDAARAAGRQQFEAVKKDYEATIHAMLAPPPAAAPSPSPEGTPAPATSRVGSSPPPGSSPVMSPAPAASTGTPQSGLPAMAASTPPPAVPAAGGPIAGLSRTTPPLASGSGRLPRIPGAVPGRPPGPGIGPGAQAPGLQPNAKAETGALPGNPAPETSPAGAPSPGPSPDVAGSDSEAPRLASIQFIPREAPDGSEVRVVVSATDNLSGPAGATGSIASPSRKVFIPFQLVADPATGSLSGSLRIPPDSEAGVWKVASVRLVDKAQNAIALTDRDPLVAASALTVLSGRSDNDPPILDGLELSPLQVEDGGTVHVAVRAHDEKTAVQSVRGILANPSKTVQLNFYPKLNPGSGAFEGTVTLPKHSEFGEWTVTLVTLTDTANNRATLTDDERLRSARVTVVSSSSDTNAPQLLTIAVEPSRIAQGENVQVVVTASDDLSGVRDISGFASSPNGLNQPTLHFRAGAAQGEFRYALHIDEAGPVGTWRIDRLSLIDGAGNRVLLTTTNPILATAQFEVVLR